MYLKIIIKLNIKQYAMRCVIRKIESTKYDKQYIKECIIDE